MEVETSTSNHIHCDDLNRTDNRTVKSSRSPTPASSSNTVPSCHEKQPALSSCTCSQSNILRIDNHSKGLHVDIHRGLFSSSKNASSISDDNNNNNNNNNSSSINRESHNWYQQLLTNVQWHRVKYKSNRFQKNCETPCYTAFYGGRSEHRPYTPVPSWFQPLIDQVTSHLGSNGKVVMFNAFLLRLYFDGKDEIAWHTDGRKFLGEQPTIASLSMGSKATFQLRRMNEVWPCADGSKSTDGCVDVNTPIESFVLCDGDLLVMRGDTQKHWHHRVPKEKGRGVRLNINFRYILPGLDSERGQRTYYKYMVYGDCPMDSQPPSWTFDEVMAKKGGMMNFVQRGKKRKDMNKQNVGEIENEQSPTEEHRDAKDRKLKESVSCEISDTAALSSKVVRSTNPEYCKTFNDDDDDTEQYLANEESVDPEVFLALPTEIRSELVSQWKSQKKKQPNIIIPPSPLSQRKNVRTTKRPRSVNKAMIGHKTDLSCRKGTLDSFFSKK